VCVCILGRLRRRRTETKKICMVNNAFSLFLLDTQDILLVHPRLGLGLGLSHASGLQCRTRTYATASAATFAALY
jgi:hypothetical protein